MTSPSPKVPYSQPVDARPQRRTSQVAAAVALVLGVACAPMVMAQSADTSAAPASSTNPSLQAGPLTLLFGGFTELATIYRSRDESTDVGSSFGGVPLGNAEQSNLSEFRESARQSRLSLLARTGDQDGYRLETWFEMDFLGAAATANSNESNSYNLRMRNIYGRFISDSGWYILGGQSWSLTTLEKNGMEPRNEDAPLTIDAQYAAGFTWTRNAQLRFVDKVADKTWLGISLESPQATGIVNSTSLAAGGTAVPMGTSLPPAGLTTSFPGTGQLGNGGGSTAGTGSNFSTDIAPDVVVKVAADPGYGHYELFGLARWFRSAIGTNSQTTMGGGIGGGMILPLVPNTLTFQLSALIGKGIGRYGTSGLNDVVVKPDGELAPVQAYQVLAGLIYSPTPAWQAYLYAGREQQSATLYPYSTAGVGPYWYGLGSAALNNSGCYTLGGTCQGQNRKVDEVTGGFWWKFYRGALGNAQFGLQAGYIQRTLFSAVGGSPDAGMFEGMASLRIYPYQK